MPTELKPVEFALEDRVHDQPLTPETVDLPTLRAFLNEVETLIKGNVEGADVTLTESRVRIEEGSLKVVALISALLAANLDEDLSQLRESGDLDVIQPKRAEVIEQWQARARRMPYRSYSISEDRQPRVEIVKTSEFQHGGEKAWVSVEKVLIG